MPVAVSYPGVYIEEVPSGVRTITGVATSITAFVGRSLTGPVSDPVTINSFADFERGFGGMHVDYPLAYTVQQFYQNGGGRAIIVRLYKKDGSNPEKAKIKLKAGDGTKEFVLEAAAEGAWANTLRARVDSNVADEVAQKFGLTKDKLFNLTLRDTKTGAQQQFVNVTLAESPRRLDRILVADGAWMRVAEADPTKWEFPKAHEAKPEAGKTEWDDATDPAKATSTKVADADKAADSAALTAKDDYGKEADKSGVYALKKVDLFNLLCIPPDTRDGDTLIDVYKAALTFCVQRRAMLIVDPPKGWADANGITKDNNKALTDLGLGGEAARNAALFFPRLIAADPLRGGQLDGFVPCGAVAGIMARTDGRRGVWKAPAGIDAAINGISGLKVSLTDDENGMLNPLGVNCLRVFPIIGAVVWGARTLRGADLIGDEYKYIPVRRLALFIEESLFRGTQWVVFEPNDEPLWAQIRLNVGAFMHDLFRQGAFQGQTPDKAYFVKCDKDTTTQSDINKGIVNIVVGFAPLKPAEFVILKIQQIAGDIAT